MPILCLLLLLLVGCADDGEGEIRGEIRGEGVGLAVPWLAVAAVVLVVVLVRRRRR